MPVLFFAMPASLAIQPLTFHLNACSAATRAQCVANAKTSFGYCPGKSSNHTRAITRPLFDVVISCKLVSMSKTSLMGRPGAASSISVAACFVD